jgi:hypothetical protein
MVTEHPAGTVAQLVQHAREMLDVIDQECTAGSATMPEGARQLLDQMRDRLASLERALVTVH